MKTGMLHYRSLIPPLAALLAVVLCAHLGLWQLHRADEAKALEDAVAAKAQAAPIELDPDALQGDLSALHWRRIEARGILESRQVLLDNQVSHGAAGYFVYTPLSIPDCNCAVLVNRGWVAAGPRRDVPPDVGLARHSATIRGVAAPAPFSGFRLHEANIESLDYGSLRVQTLDAAELSQRLGEHILPLTVLMSPEDPDGYRREWRLPEARADRHMAYAVQWFIFAAIAAGLALRLNSRLHKESNRTP
jgi:surfeit locus 1 family protein